MIEEKPIQNEQLEFIYNFEKNVSIPLKWGMTLVCTILTLSIEPTIFWDSPIFRYGFTAAVAFNFLFTWIYTGWLPTRKELGLVKRISYLSFAQEVLFVTFLLSFTGGMRSLLHLVYGMFFVRAAVNYTTIVEILIAGLGIFTPIYFVGISFAEQNFNFLESAYFWGQYLLIWGVIIACFGVVSLLSQQTKKIENQLKEIQDLQSQLIQVEKMASIGQLAGGIAHELNNPLGSILGFSQILVKETHEEDPKKQDLQRIERAAYRCKKIIESLLSFARQRDADFKELSLNDVLEETLALCENQLKKSRIEVVKQLSLDTPRILGDSNQLQQVFTNLIVNAVDAMTRGGKLTLTTQMASSEKAVAGVSDTGEGISKEHLNKIFDPFFTTKEVGKGTGLGLSIVYGIVKKHNGEIKVISQPGQGTKFSLEFPSVSMGGIKEKETVTA